MPAITIDGSDVYVDGVLWITFSQPVTLTGGSFLTVEVPANSYYILGIIDWPEAPVLGPGGVTFMQAEYPPTFYIQCAGFYVHFVDGPISVVSGGANVIAVYTASAITFKVYWSDSASDLIATQSAYDALGDAYPGELVWADRRPIGLSFPNGFVDGTNRWNWWGYADQAAFEQGFHDHIDTCIAYCLEADAQGLIIWSIEGQYNGHPISYIGDPEMHATYAPEVNRPLVLALFQKIRDAGLRPGVCVRPHTIRAVEWNSFGLWQFEVEDAEYEANLMRKIGWAYETLGCRIFYIDSVMRVDPYSRDPAYGDYPITAAVMPLHAMFKRIADAFPGALMIPEQYTPAWSGIICPFTGGLNSPGEGLVSIYPTCFNFLFGQNYNYALPETRALLQASVSAGSIPTFEAWYPSPGFNAVMSLTPYNPPDPEEPLMNVTFNLFAPTGYTPELVIRRKDTLAAIGDPVELVETDSPGYYSGDVDVGEYEGDVIGSLTGPFGAVAGRVSSETCFLGDEDDSDILDALAAIMAKTNLIGTGTVTSSSMVSPAGLISRPITIGDDYLVANARAFEWLVDPVEGFAIGDVVVVWGGARQAKPRDVFSGTGTVEVSGDQWLISCELPKEATENLTPGLYDWSVELTVAGVEVTRVQNVTRLTGAHLIRKQT